MTLLQTVAVVLVFLCRNELETYVIMCLWCAKD